MTNLRPITDADRIRTLEPLVEIGRAPAKRSGAKITGCIGDQRIRSHFSRTNDRFLLSHTRIRETIAIKKFRDCVEQALDWQALVNAPRK